MTTPFPHHLPGANDSLVTTPEKKDRPDIVTLRRWLLSNLSPDTGL
ncbi:hypothetical protein [Rahnella victoriana]|nr:hypothetical protein [Rahnella victoriana]UHM91034.1 hypothetical protein J9880_01260 [Rahnella victoriana]